MKRFARALVAVLGLAVLGSFVLLVPQKNATGAGAAPVMVVNTTPVPVTGNVNATVTGTVAAQQSGSWNVGVTGTPSVNIANTPSVNVTSLPAVAINGNINATVSNPVGASGSIPLVVQDSENAARHAFSGHCDMAALPGPGNTAKCSSGSGALVVPAGQILVVEYVSGFVIASSPKATEFFLTGTSPAGSTVFTEFVPTDVGPVSSLVSGDASLFSSLTRLYFAPGTQVDCASVTTVDNSFVIGGCHISGYLVAPWSLCQEGRRKPQ